MSNVLTKPLAKGCLYGAVIPFIVFFLLLFAGATGDSFLLEIPFRLICGWVFHVEKTIPPFLSKWPAALLPLGCLVLAVWLTHSFICRWAKAKRPNLTWRIKYTLSIYSLLFLSSAAAIAMSGIVHQFFWLSKEDVIESGSRMSDQEYAKMQARDLCGLMFLYFVENGKYPDSMNELMKWNEGYLYDDEYLLVGDIPEPFILLQPGLVRQPSSIDPIVLSPYIQSVNQYAIGYGDGSVELINSETLKIILKQLKEPEPDDPHE